MILKIFSPKNSAKKLAFFTKKQSKIFKKLIITLVFEKNANFLQKIGKNWQKLAKIVIITSTLGCPDEFFFKCCPKCSPAHFLGRFLKISQVAQNFGVHIDLFSRYKLS
jgi:hypothetical protein